MVLFRLEEERFKNESRLAELEEARAELSRIRTLLDDHEELADRIDAWYAEWLDDEDDLSNMGQMLADKLKAYLLGEEE